jgi:PAS domain S-box-containing protein
MNNKYSTVYPYYNRLASAAGIVSAVAGLLILAGWLFDFTPLKTFGISPVPMKANPALAFFFAGISLILLNLKSKSKTTVVIAKTFAAIVFLIGLITVFEYLFQINSTVDQILFKDAPGAILTTIPGRMSFVLALGLTFEGMALLSAGIKNQFAKGLITLAAGIGLLSILSYILRLTVLLEMVGVNTIALNSSILLLILSAGIYFSLPERKSEKSKVERQITFVSAIIVILLVAANITTLLVDNKSGEFDKLIASSNKINEKVEHILRLISDVDSDFKDYAVTRKENYILSINKLDSEIHWTINELKVALVDPREKVYLDSLRALCEKLILLDKVNVSGHAGIELQTAGWVTAVQTNDNMIITIDDLGRKFISLESDLYNYRRNKELTAADEASRVQVLMMFLQFGFLIVISVIISRDILARTKAEKSLKESEEKFRSISYSAADAIITADSKGVIVGWNRGAEKIFGFNEHDIIGKNLTTIVPKSLIEQHIEGMNRVQHGGEHRVLGKTVELIGLHKNGTQFPVEISLSEWESSSGKYFSGIIRDITERKQIDLEQQVIYEITNGITATSNLDQLLNLMHASLCKRLYAENCFVALHNPVTGLFSFPYFVDKYDPAPPPVALKKSCTEYVFRTQKPLLFTPEVFARLKEKNEVELVGSPSPSWLGVPLQTPKGIIGVLVIQHYELENVYHEHDIEFLVSVGSQIATAIERKLDEEEILTQNEKLSNLNAEKDKFFSIIAHDLRSPFTGLLNLTEMMAKESESFSIPEYLESSKLLNESVNNIYKLITNLFEWAQLQKGTKQFSPQMLTLHKIVCQIIESSILHAKKKNINIINNVPFSIQLFADENMIKTVIRNLVSNAIKFTESGGCVTICAGPAVNGGIEISVSDTGVGMPEDLVKKLFKIGEKTGSTGTAGELSTGLGLLLCKEFVEKHNGQIQVESVLGKGSTFKVILPVL